MGNKLGGCRNRQIVDERYTRPQGLYVNKDADVQKLRKLIIESKLAPCYPGADELRRDLEECPICFLYYPSLNRSRCCLKSICTECFLQIKGPNSIRPTQCPFCKTSNYAVEYRGEKTKEEKGMEQIEEQRFIEAKIRMRQKEILDDKERTQKRQEVRLEAARSSSMDADVDNCEAAASSYSDPMEDEEFVSCRNSSAASTVRQMSCPRTNRDEEFDVDLEDIMVMEAIWLSIQEMSKCENAVSCDSPSYGRVSEDRYISPSFRPVSRSLSSSSPSQSSSPSRSPSSSSGELTHPIGETSNGENSSSFYMFPANNTGNYNLVETDNYQSVHTSSCSSSYDSTEDNSGGISMWKLSGGVQRTFQGILPPMCPESFEEQMMLAMSGSLAEVHSTTSGVVWQ